MQGVPGVFNDIAFILKRYYKTAMEAMIDCEIETNFSVKDGVSALSDAFSCLSQCVLGDNIERAQAQAGRAFTEAILSFRQQIHAYKSAQIESFVKEIRAYEYLLAADEQVRLQEILRRNKDLGYCEHAWIREDWEDACNKYKEAAEEFDVTIDCLDDLLVELKSRKIMMG
jgi:hypothetical protein